MSQIDKIEDTFRRIVALSSLDLDDSNFLIQTWDEYLALRTKEKLEKDAALNDAYAALLRLKQQNERLCTDRANDRVSEIPALMSFDCS